MKTKVSLLYTPPCHSINNHSFFICRLTLSGKYRPKSCCAAGWLQHTSVSESAILGQQLLPLVMAPRAPGLALAAWEHTQAHAALPSVAWEHTHVAIPSAVWEHTQAHADHKFRSHWEAGFTSLETSFGVPVSLFIFWKGRVLRMSLWLLAPLTCDCDSGYSQELFLKYCVISALFCSFFVF